MPSAAPLLQAEQVCVRAILGAYEDQVISGILGRTGLAGAYEGATIGNDYVEFQYEASGGQIFNAEFTYGKLIFETIGAAAGQKLIPRNSRCSASSDRPRSTAWKPRGGWTAG